MKPTFFSRVLLGMSLMLMALDPVSAVNKCTTKDGKTVYQDAACESTATGSQSVKTWDNTPGAYHSTPRSRTVEPTDSLDGPSQIAPLLQIYRRWIDAEKLAVSTARVALSTPVASLQSINREVEGISVAACAADSKKALLALTKQSSETMIQFMQQKELAGMVYQFLDRPKLITAFEQSVRLTTCKA